MKKQIYKKKMLAGLCLMALVFSSFMSCAKYKTAAYTDVETKLIGAELDGSYTLRVAGRGRNAVAAYNQASKQAVHDVIFTQIQVQTGLKQPALMPLVNEVNAEEKYRTYFANFFKDGGEYLKYASMKEKRLETSRWWKTKTTVVGLTTVSVAREELRAKLIEDGILKK